MLAKLLAPFKDGKNKAEKKVKAPKSPKKEKKKEEAEVCLFELPLYLDANYSLTRFPHLQAVTPVVEEAAKEEPTAAAEAPAAEEAPKEEAPEAVKET